MSRSAAKIMQESGLERGRGREGGRGRDTCRRCFCGSSALSFRPNRNTEVHERNEEDNCNVPYARCSQTIKQTNYSRNGSALTLSSNGGARNLIWPKINLSLSLTARLPSRHVPPGAGGRAQEAVNMVPFSRPSSASPLPLEHH